MVGTRLWIQSVVLAEVLALAALSFFWGFCVKNDDVLCCRLRLELMAAFNTLWPLFDLNDLPLLPFEDDLARNALEQSFTIPLETAEQAVLWQSAAQTAVNTLNRSNQSQGRSSLNLAFVVGENTNEISNVCRDPNFATVSSRPVWICDPVDIENQSMHGTGKAARVVVTQQSIVIYPSAHAHYSTIVSELLLSAHKPTNSHSMCHSHTSHPIISVAPKLEIQLLVERGSEVHRWANAVAQWKIESDLSLWPNLQTTRGGIDHAVQIHIVPVPPKTTTFVHQNLELAKTEYREQQKKRQLERRQRQQQQQRIQQAAEGLPPSEEDSTNVNQLLTEAEQIVIDEEEELEPPQPNGLSVAQVTSILQEQSITLNAAAAAAVPKSRAYDDELLQVLLYVPAQLPLRLEDTTSSSGYIGKRQFVSLVTGIIGSGEDAMGDYDTHYVSFVRDALHGGVDRLLLVDLGLEWLLPSLSTENSGRGNDSIFIVQHMDGSFPKWHTELWWSTVLKGRLQCTLAELQLSRDLLQHHKEALSLAFNMDADTTKYVTQVYREANDHLRATTSYFLDPNDVTDEIYLHSPNLIANRLDQAFQNAKLIQQHLTLTSHFPFEHYLAMFAPLLFPLLLPFTVSWFRERKRYREKSKQQSESST